MERFTISLADELAHDFDALIAERGYGNRSEAVRDLIRAAIETHRQSSRESDKTAHCVANLSYVFDHHLRDLAERLTDLQHRHHDLSVATLHAHLDHSHCLESAVLRGPIGSVRRFADAVIAERGVHHGQLNLISVDVEQAAHHHATGADQPGHAHPHPHGKPGRHLHYKPAR
jgi:CopG family transcriptional regulator, nickel-responsive regulator